MAEYTTANWSVLFRQQRQVLTELGTVRDDMVVVIATLQRLYGTVAEFRPMGDLEVQAAQQ